MGKLLPNYKAMLIGLKPDNITFELLLDLFADKMVGEKGKKTVKKSKINTFDEFELKAGEYFNKQRVVTNAGLFVYNKLIIEERFAEVLGYVNEPLNKKAIEKIEDKLSKALLNDKINVEDMVYYLNTTQWLAMQFHSVISGSFTSKSLKPIPKVIKERDRLLKENKDKLEKGDVETAVKIEQQLLKMAKEELKDDHGMDLYKSGARGSFDNNFKNISVMRGPVFNPVTGKFDVVKSNFMEGIKKEEIPVYGNSIISGAYPKAIGTATSGYFSKQILSALQAVVLDKPGSDCHTKATVDITIIPGTENDFLYKYIVENGKLVLLDDDNISKYAGRKVRLRSPMTCITDKVCTICAGEMYNKLGIQNLGLTAARVSSSLLNLSMKKFHDSTAKIKQIDLDTITIAV